MPIDPEIISLAREMRISRRNVPDMIGPSTASGSRPKAQFNVPDGAIGDFLGYEDDGSGNPILQAVSAPSGGSSIDYGPIASLPAAGSAGAVYACSDTPLTFIDTGTGWALWEYPSRPLTFIVSGDFSWQNQGGASIDTSMGGVRLSCPIGAGANWRMRLKAYPTPPFTITVYLNQMPPGVSHISSGLVLFDGTKVISFGQYVNQNTNTPQDVVALSKWTAVNAFSADYESQHQVNGRMPSWFRFNDDNTNRLFEYSYDGHHWIRRNHLTITRTDFLTPTHIGFGGNHEQNSGSPHLVWLMSWKQT